MPVWYETLKPFVNENKVVILGVVQEQHASRTRLYRQWGKYDFPIVQDPMTKLGMRAVPLIIAIDEQGIVRGTKLRPNQVDSQFLSVDYAKQSPLNQKQLDPEFQNRLLSASRPLQEVRDRVTADPSYLSQINLADALILKALSDTHRRANQAKSTDVAEPPNKGDNYENTQMQQAVLESVKQIQEAISLYKTVYEGSENPSVAFRLAVAYRMAFDSEGAAPLDFANASKFWTQALSKDPNQYIWRRRIEQYGPRMNKPYPFYDWIPTAQKEVAERGEIPWPQTVALTDSELAQPARGDWESQPMVNPDPETRITRSPLGIVRVDSTMVPYRLKPTQTGRLHLQFSIRRSKWNHESEPLMVWLEPNPNVQLQTNRLNPQNALRLIATSSLPQTVEVDLTISKDFNAASDGIELRGFALFNRCVDESGVCVYERFDFRVQIPVEQ